MQPREIHAFIQFSCFTIYREIHMPLPLLRFNSTAQDIKYTNMQPNFLKKDKKSLPTIKIFNFQIHRWLINKLKY